MKTLHIKPAAGLIRSGLLIALSLGLSAMAANAAKVINIPLAGEEFGNSSEAHGESTDSLDAANAYFYRLVGTCVGTGDFADAVPPGTKISDLVNEIQQGAAAALAGTKRNPGAALPFEVLNKTIHGTHNVKGFDVTFDITVSITIQANGRVVFDIKDITITGPWGYMPNGTIKLEPGTKVVAGVAPVIEMDKGTQAVAEDAGFVAVKVTRGGNLNVACSVNYKTIEGTATAGTAATDDFKAKSGKLDFLAGESTKTIKVPIKDNALQDGTRKFSVKLVKPVTAVLGDVTATVVSINSNE